MGEATLRLAARICLVTAATVASCLPISPPAVALFDNPRISSISPALGPTDGGTTVTIRGSGFLGASLVSFGSLPAPYLVVSDATIVAFSPPEAEGVVQVRVATPWVTSPDAGSADDFRYHLQPRISGVSPSQALDTGGVPVRITGSGFAGATSVRFGRAAASFTVEPGGSAINAVLPPKDPADPNVVRVVVSNQWTGSTTMLFATQDDFHYFPVPHITSVSPDEGPSGGGFTIEIIGTGFTEATTVYFGTEPFTDIRVDTTGTQILIDAPEHDIGTVELTVANELVTGPPRSDSADEIGFFEEHSIEGMLATKINNYRASRGKNRLAGSSVLAEGARAWSQQMAEDGFGHDPSNWCPSSFRACGELVQAEDYDGAATAAAFAEELFQAFRVSSDHNAVMLGTFTHLGVGIYFDAGFANVTVRLGRT